MGQEGCLLVLFEHLLPFYCLFPSEEFWGNHTLDFVVGTSSDGLCYSCFLFHYMLIFYPFFFNKPIFQMTKDALHGDSSQKPSFLTCWTKTFQESVQITVEMVYSKRIESNVCISFALWFLYSKSSKKIYFRVLKMSFSSRRDVTSFSRSWCLEEFSTASLLVSCIFFFSFWAGFSCSARA